MRNWNCIASFFAGLEKWPHRASTRTDYASTRTDVRDAIISGQPAEIVRFSAVELFDAYDSNEVAADISLKGKIVEVTGRVESINKNVLDKIYVSLATKNRFMPANMHVVPSDEAQIAALRKGQIVVFRCL